MTQYDLRLRFLATALAGLAGFVDAIGFLELGGFFISFMSGNSTRLGVGIASVSTQAAVAAGLIACFVLGVVLGSLLGTRAGDRRRSAVLGLVTVLLGLAGLLAAPAPVWIATAPLALAMGAANAVFERDGDVSIGVTYMTGALVKAGHRIATALRGGDPLGWWPYVQLWIGLVVGGACGATAYALIGRPALWIAVAIAFCCCLMATYFDRPRPAA